MTSPSEEPRNPYSSGQQGQNQQYQQPGYYELNGVLQQPYYNQQAHGQPSPYPRATSAIRLQPISKAPSWRRLR